MNIEDFLRTIYLGDRACKAIEIDGWEKTVRIKVDCISRLQTGTEAWNYYTDEDVVDGFLVFREVERVTLENAGYLPNDELDLRVVESSDDLTTVEASIRSVDQEARCHEITLRFAC